MALVPGARGARDQQREPAAVLHDLRIVEMSAHRPGLVPIAAPADTAHPPSGRRPGPTC
jgi:hypothetical protein